MSNWVEGTMRVELAGADPLGAMNIVNQKGITISCLRMENELTVSFDISRSDYRRLYKMVHHRGWRLKVKRKLGIYWILHGLLCRPILFVGLLTLFILTLYVPTRVLFVEVVGNQSVPDQMIIEAAANCGIDFGASRRMIRSEKVKNSLLAQLPQLQWLGVNTRGCVAEISVQEKTHTDVAKQPLCISSIIASRDGIISSMYVSSGIPLCEVGQAVKAGQLLVSGYSDCGICIHGTKAEGEIFADTKREMEAVIPNLFAQRSEKHVTSKKYSLIIGKKRINLYKGSGISDTTCGKMYVEDFITLPGGFQLPIGLLIETHTSPASVEPIQVPETLSAEVLLNFSKDYLIQKMIAGEIQNMSYALERNGDADRIYGEYMCCEMIGRIRIEEIIE